MTIKAKEKDVNKELFFMCQKTEKDNFDDN